MVDETEIEALIALLPFYANGTLEKTDIARVDAALARSERLRNELRALSELARVVKVGGRKLTEDEGDREARLETLLGRLEDHPPQSAKPQTAVSQQSERAGLLSFLSPRRWHPAVPLALALAVGTQAAAMVSMNATNEKAAAQIAALQQKVGSLEFQLASGPGGEAPRGNIIIQVNDDASWAAVSALLSSEGLSIVGGPSDGALTLSSTMKGAALDAQIARIKASRLIASADKAA
jgi:anti-sigma factor RsiW